MVERVSALQGHVTKGRFGEPGKIAVHVSEVPDLILHQIAAWPETLTDVGARAAAAIGAGLAPGPCSASTGGAAALLRIDPLKFWLFGAEPLALEPDEGAVLDLSHSRTHIRIAGPDAAALLNRHLPLDLRESHFPVGAVASTAFHHCGVTLWRSQSGYELFLPRGFALSLWDLLLESAAQFGGEVV